MILKILISLFVFQTTAGAEIAYSHLKKEQSDRLLETATKICEQTAKIAKETKSQRLTEAHKRSCIDRKPPSLTSLIVAFHHLNVETKKGPEKEFFRKNLMVLAALVQITPDFPEPKSEWSVRGVVDELSGLAYDKKRNLIWSHGDSGTGPLIGRTSIDGFKTEKLQVDGANNRDWEAIVVDDAGFVWVLDVGDNRAAHKSVVAYQLNPGDIKGTHITVKRKIEATYEGGARDVEAAVMSDGKIYLIEKEYYRESRISTIDIGEKSEPKQISKSFGTIPPTPPITDAAIAENGKLILLTYFGIFEIANWKTGKLAPTQLNDQILGQVEAITIVGGKTYVGREDGKVFVDSENLK